jgi:serine/threonine-protein kinase OSR1/STK39
MLDAHRAPRAHTNATPQEDIIQEAHTMKSYSHPNVLSLLASFVTNQELYMVTPFMSGGSALHIMKYAFPEVREV